MVGFHDICPWDPANRVLAVLRIDPDVIGLQGPRATGEICIWDPAANRVDPVQEGAAWSWEQAARQQWMPNRPASLIFNRWSGDGAHARIVDLSTGRTEDKAFTAYCVSPDGRYALSHHFGRLGRYWASYGYVGLDAPQLDSPAPEGDGLYLLDLEQDKVNLLLSINDIAGAYGGAVTEDTRHFISHPSFSPTGKRFCFMHRFHAGDGGFPTRLFVSDLSTKELILVASGKVSHFAWRDDDSMILWTRDVTLGGGARSPIAGMLSRLRERNVNNSLLRSALFLGRRLGSKSKQRLLKEHYYLITLSDPPTVRIIAPGVLDQDGHPMFSRDGSRFVTDTYAGPDGRQTLMTYDLLEDRRHDVGWFSLPEKIRATGAKCDLHPRYDRQDARICIDSAHDGTRQVYLLESAG